MNKIIVSIIVVGLLLTTSAFSVNAFVAEKDERVGECIPIGDDGQDPPKYVKDPNDYEKTKSGGFTPVADEPINNGENWTRTFGGRFTDEVGHCVEQTKDGGYIVIGGNEFGEMGTDGVWLIKLNPHGTKEWIRKYPGSQGHCVKQTEDGGYVLFSNYFNSISLMKTDSYGEVEWSRIFNGVLCDYHEGDNRVQQTSDGGYILTAMTDPYEFGYCDILLIKTDENGVEEWHKTYGKNNHRGSSVQETTDGGFIILGDFYYMPIWGGSIVLIKTDSNGNEEWNKTLYESDWAFAKGCSAQQTSDGGYFVCAYNNDDGGFIVKTDSNGNDEWRNMNIGYYGWNEFYSAQQTSDGGYIITGGYGSLGPFDPPPTQLLLMKLNEAGEVEWDKKFGKEGKDYDIGMSVRQTSDSGYIIAGVHGVLNYLTFSFRCDILVMKTDANGNAPPPAVNEQATQQQSTPLSNPLVLGGQSNPSPSQQQSTPQSSTSGQQQNNQPSLLNMFLQLLERSPILRTLLGL